MRSPLRPIPSLGRRRKRAAGAHLLLAVPRISPERELAAIQALIKPQTGAALRQQIDSGEQPWPADGGRRVAQALAAAKSHFGVEIDLHLPPAGEYFAVGQAPADQAPAVLATALLLSHRLPGAWVVVGRLFVRDGVLFRRERGIKLNLRPATNVHLCRQLRPALRKALSEIAG